MTELRAAQLGERLVADELRAILEGVADSVTAQAPDGSLVYANEAAVRVLGFAAAEALLAAPLAEIMIRCELLTPEGEPLPLAELPGPPRADGRAARARARPFTTRDEPARSAGRASRPSRSATPTARCALAINVIEDITELKQAEQSQRFLAEASRVLAGSLDYESDAAPRSRSSRSRTSPTGAASTSSATTGRAPPRRGRPRRPGEGRAGRARSPSATPPTRATTAACTTSSAPGESQLCPEIPRRADRRGARRTRSTCA